jgi:hypothetical protein
MDELLNQLSEAVASQNWLVVVIVGVVLALALVSVVLKAIGKPVPLLDTLLDFAKRVIPSLPKKAPPAPVDGKQGVAAIIPVEETKKPIEELK